MKQRLISEKDKAQVISSNNLEYGQLGRIVNHGTYDGMIVTKSYEALLCVYSERPSDPAFKTTWTNDASFKVELLTDEQVVLSNE